ncbi:MAG: SdpI family protein [Clostridia bacterium]|nr:SdpI family protein [Clostridia bacterium]
MKKRLSKVTVITTVLTMLPMILGAVLYDRLPDVVATHWGFNGQPDGWSAKWMACFGIPGFMAAMNLIISVAMDISMATESGDKLNGTSKVVVNISRWIVPVLSIIIVPMMLFYELGYEMNVEKIVCTVMGVLFVVLGNYLPKCRRNYYVGIKLPWTLKSEENWNKTHRLGGFVWMICGILMLISAWAGTSWVTVAVLFAMILVPCVYSYILHRRGV